MFANSSCKDEQVEASQLCGVSADVFANGKGKDVYRQRCFCIAVFCPDMELPHVGYAIRNGFQSGFVIQQRFQTIGVHVFGPHQKKQDPRIEVSRARGHGDATGRRHAHTGVYGFAIAQRNETRAATQMRADHTRWDFCSQLVQYRFIREAVKSIPLYSFAR